MELKSSKYHDVVMWNIQFKGHEPSERKFSLLCFSYLFLVSLFCPCHINLMNQPVSTVHKNTLLFISGIRVEYLN